MIKSVDSENKNKVILNSDLSPLKKSKLEVQNLRIQSDNVNMMRKQASHIIEEVKKSGLQVGIQNSNLQNSGLGDIQVSHLVNNRAP